jgi:hypothetical protein
LLFLTTRSARAQAAESQPQALLEPQIQVSDCPEELPAVVKLEVDVLLRERGPTHAAPERIAIRCAEERAQIAVTMAGVSRESSIELGVLAPEHRARAVALAAAELVHSMSSRPLAEEAPARGVVAPVSPAVTSERSPPDVASRGAWQRPALLVGGLAEWLGKPAMPLFGGRLALQYPVGRVVVPALSVDGSLGGFPSESARVTVATLSAAAHLYLGTTTGSVRWDLGPGARFGWLRLAGHPDQSSMLEGRSLAAAWGGPEARARVAYGSSPGSPLFALEVGAGIVALPVRGLVDGAQRVYAVQGPWLSVCAEVGVGL